MRREHVTPGCGESAPQGSESGRVEDVIMEFKLECKRGRKKFDGLLHMSQRMITAV